MRVAETSSGVGVTVLASFLPQLWPLVFSFPVPPLLVYAGVTIGLLLTLFGLLHDLVFKPKFETFWLPMMKLHPTRDNLFPFRRALRIRDAAQMAYDRTHNTSLGVNARNWAVDKPIGDELSTYAHYFKDLGGYTLYGKRPPSNIYQVVPASRLNSLWFTNDLNGLKHLGGGQDAPQYVDIAVTRSDVKKLIKEAKAIDRGTAQTITDKAKRSSAALPAPFLEGLLRNEWVLNFNPLLSAKQKRISFDEDGTIGAGRNGNEYKWKIVDQKLEIWRANGKLQNRFSYDSEAERFVSISDPKADGISNQVIYRLKNQNGNP